MNEIKSQTLSILNSRHACKIFSDKKIPKEDFDFILETARLSPSSFGYEPWHFLVIQNQTLREKLSKFISGNQLLSCSHFVIILSKLSEDFTKISDYIKNIDTKIIKIDEEKLKIKHDFFINFVKNELKNDPKKIESWIEKQTYIPLANMLNSASQIGIDSCPMEGFSQEGAMKILKDECQIDDKKFKISCMCAFGYRLNEPRPKTRQKIEQIVTWF